MLTPANMNAPAIYEEVEVPSRLEFDEYGRIVNYTYATNKTSLESDASPIFPGIGCSVNYNCG
jgi:hypothetical protein